jgi:hypothetical protein
MGRRGSGGSRKTQFKKGNPGGPGRPPDLLGRELRQLTQKEFSEIANLVIRGNYQEIQRIALDRTAPICKVMVAQAIMGAYKRREFSTFNQILDRIVGRTTTPVEVSGGLGIGVAASNSNKKKTFTEFCVAASYPAPFPKQIEMKDFGSEGEDARLLLGARGIGKTDYVTILGEAYEIYSDWFDNKDKPSHSCLLITKSAERNSAILEEILKACVANGVPFEKETNVALRVKGLIGKDHSMSSVPIKTKSFRGRHPKKIIMDDPVTEDDVSEATRKQAQRVYNEVSKLCKNILIIGQPVHKQDLYGKLRPLLKKKMEVPHGCIPELDHDLEAQRAAGVSEESIQASYFLKVISENAAPLENVKFLPSFPKVETAVAFIDPSYEGGDYTALSIISQYFDGVAVRGRCWQRAWNNCASEIVKECVAHNVKRVCLETNNLGDFGVETLRQAFANTGIGVVGKKSITNKHARIMNAGPYAPLIHLAKDSDRVYIDQVILYEYGASHDDAPDSLATGLEWVGLIRGKKL